MTEILSICGLVDFSRVATDVLENARARGGTLHEWLELVNGGFIAESDEPPPEVAGYVAAYFKFRRDTGFVAKAWETVVRNTHLGYCGTFDQLGEFPGVGALLIDTKATATIEPWVRLQVVGYAMALDPRPARAALRLIPDGTYRFERFTKRDDEHNWISACRMAHWKLAHGLARLED